MVKKILLSLTVFIHFVCLTQAQNNALNFDGVNDVVNVPYTTTLGANPFTVEYWVKPSQVTAVQWVVSKDNGNGNMDFITGISASAKFRFAARNYAFDLNGTTNAVVGTWYHVANVYDGTTARIYLNGNLEAILTVTGSFVSNSQSVRLGCRQEFSANTQFFQGDLDEVRIWNIGRTQAQIQNAFNQNLVGNEPSLVAYYNFNQGVAGGTNTGLTTLLGLTIPPFNGTLTNFALTGANSNWVSGVVYPASTLLGSAINPSTGNTPYYVAIADFNNDGNPDLATANLNSNNFSIVTGSGTGNFGSPVNYSSLSSGPISIVANDYNSDGWADVAVLNNGGSSIFVFTNTGLGTFGSGASYSTSGNPNVLVNGDFNGDGKIDLAVSQYTAATIGVFLNNGNGTFATRADYTGPVNLQGLATGDINGDGILDLVTASNSSAVISVLTGTGNGTFGTKADYTTAGGTISIAIGDFNRDGFNDVAGSINATDQVSVLLGTGSGTLATKVDYTVGDGPFGIGSADMNGDGFLDLVVSNALSNNLSVLTNTGTGIFGTKIDFPLSATPRFITLGDLNKDQKPDIAIGQNSGTNVAVLFNTFSTPAPTFVSISNPLSVCGVNAAITANFTGGFLNYQWYRNGVSIAGANTVTLTSAISGAYYVVASNIAGSATSSVTTITACNNALQFNGNSSSGFTDNSVSVSNNPSDFNLPNFTFEAWVNYTGNNANNTIFSKGNGNGANNEYIFQIGGGFLQLYNGHPTLYTMYNSGFTIPSNTWTHVAATYNSTTSILGFYVNGNLVNSQIALNFATPTGASNSNFFIGIQGADCRCNRFNGQIDEARIWNVARTPNDIQANLYRTINGNLPGLVAAYNFNHGVGGANNAGITTLVDQAGGNNNGTLNAFTLNGATSNWVGSITTITGAYQFGAPYANMGTPPSVCINGTATYTITATGQGSFAYQWYRNNVLLAGQTSATLNLTPALTSTTGTYTVQITSIYGTSTSAGVVFPNCNNALDFDGTDDELIVGNISALNLSNNFTAEAWVYNRMNTVVDGDFINAIFSKKAGGNAPGWSLFINSYGSTDGKLVFEGSNGTAIFSANSNVVPLNQWTHVALSINNGTPNMYINGSLISITGGALSITTSSTNFRIGNFEGTTFFNNGIIDEARIWNVALSQQEIQNNRFRNISSTTPGLVGYWDFNQGIPSGNNTTITSALDKSGNSANGTISGFLLNGGSSNFVSAAQTTVIGVYAFSAPSISGISSSQTVCSGITLPLSITASGSGIAYQWRKDGVNIAGATASTYTLVGFTSTSVGVYSVAITSLGGNLTSTGISLGVGCNNALNFLRANSNYVSVPHSSSLNLGANYTIEAWVNYSGNDITIIDKGNYDYAFQLNNSADGGKLAMYSANNLGWFKSTSNVPQNTWTHVAVVIAEGVGTFYINGVPSGTFSWSNVTQDANPMNIGRQSPSTCSCNHFNGSMDELKIWNISLSASDIAANMYKNVPGTTPGIAAYYKFDQGLGGQNNAGLTTVLDASSNSNHGTLQGTFLLSGSTSNWVTSATTINGTFAFATPSILNISSSQTVCSGVTMPLSVTATGSGLAYQWRKDGVNIAGATSSSLTLTGVTSTTAGIYSVIITSLGGNLTSSGISLGVGCNHTLDFDGTGDYINLGNILTPTYSKEAWINIRNGSANIISGNNTDSQHAFWTPSNVLSSGHNGAWSTVVDPAGALNLGVWYHVAVTYNSSTQIMRLYKNGIQVSSASGVAPYTGGVNNVLIGAYDPGINVFNGQMDEVRIWSKELLPQEIQNNMYRTVNTTLPGLIAAYNFNQGFPNGANAGVTTLIDQAGGDQNGSLINFALNGTTSNWVNSTTTMTGTYQKYIPGAFYGNIALSPLTTFATIGNPQGVIQLPDGRVIVSSSNNALYLYAQNGLNFTYLSSIGGTGSGLGQFNGPNHLAVNSAGLICLTEQSNHRVQVLTLNGNNFVPVRTFTDSFSNPWGIAFGPDGRMYVSVDTQHKIKVYSVNGTNFTFSTEFGTLGSGANQFSNPQGLSVGPDNRIYVSDYSNQRIQILTISGNTITNITQFGVTGSFGTATNQLYNPYDAKIDANGNVYAVSYSANSIRIFTVSGVSTGYIGQLGTTGGIALNQLSGPIAVNFSQDSKMVYVADYANSRISVWGSCDSQPEIVTQPQSQTICGTSLSSVTLSAVGVGLSYIWSNGSTSATLTTSVPGIYSVTVNGLCGYTYSNPVTITSVNCALNFDGNDQMQLGTNNIFNLQNNFTLEAWVRIPSVAGPKRRIFNRSSGTGFGFGIEANGKLGGTNYGVIDFTQSIGTLSANTWTHVAFVVNNSVLTYYINGVQSGTSSTGALPNNLGVNMKVGYSDYNPSESFTGDLDEVRIWNVAIDAVDIQANYLKQINNTPIGLSPLYDFNIGSPSGDNTSLSTIPDMSAYGFNATITSFTRNGATSNFIGAINTTTVGAYTFALPSVTNITSSQTVCSGVTIPLSVTATGTGLTYQWRKDGINIVGATASSFTLTGITSTSAGLYSVLITSVGGNLTSAGISLGVGCNNAFDFSSNAGALSLPDNNALDFTNQYTIEFWFRRTADQWATVISKFDDDANNRSWMINFGESGGADKLCVVHSRLGTWTDPISWNTGFSSVLNQWYHAAVVYDGTITNNNLKLYINGSFVSQTNWNYTLTPNVANVYIGGYDSPGNSLNGGANSRFFQGQLDELRAWNIALSESDIANNWNKTTVTSMPGLVLALDFNQGIPSGNNASISQALDKSGRNLHFGFQGLPRTGATNNFISSITTIAGIFVFTTPSILNITPSQTVCSGITLPLSVTASGSGLTYQWYKDGSPIIGANASVYSILGVTTLTSGIYSVSINGIGGTITSSGISISPRNCDFITLWNTSISGSSPSTITFGVGTTGIANYAWETYPIATLSGTGTFTGAAITVTGLPTNQIIKLSIQPTNFNRIWINYGVDRSRIIDILQWGGTIWNTFQSAFYGCNNLAGGGASDTPNLTNATSFASMFHAATLFNHPIGHWNTSNITNMSYMFYDAINFNQPLNNWNTSNVNNMTEMFVRAHAFNQPLNNWNVSLVTNFRTMFYQATSFNQPIGNWNVGNVSNMNLMFYGATSFNQSLSGWNVSNVSDMAGMFEGATSFNQNLGPWGTKLKSNVLLNTFLNNSGLSTANYDALLIGFSATTVTGRTMGAVGLKYCSGQSARNFLTSVTGRNWTISDGGIDSPIIVTQPISQTVTGSNLATFTVSATGTIVSYAWSNGLSTTNTMSTSVPGSNYVVTVNGVCGSVISNPVSLTVIQNTSILGISPSQNICSGNNVLLSVTATGSSLGYQWRKDGNNIVGATTSTYTLTGVTSTSAGLYSVMITSLGGNLTSAGITLVVKSQEINLKGNVTFDIASGDLTPSVFDGTDFESTSLTGAISKSFIITNTGTTVLNINNISITGTNPTSFSITTAPNSVISATGSTTFTVTFSSTLLGISNAIINILNDDCDESVYAFAVRGTTTAAGTALDFDGNDDRVILPFGGTNKPNSQITVEAWLYPTDVHTETFVEIARGQAVIFAFQSNATLLTFGTAGGTATVPISVANYENQWVHVAGVADGSTLSIYRNGVLLTSSTGTYIHNDGDVWIGDCAPCGTNENFKGKMDEFRVWNRGLSASEINTYMNCNPPAGEPGLYSRFDFNQGLAGANNAGITTVLDKSGNNNNGTATNFALSGTISNWAVSAINNGVCVFLPSVTGITPSQTVCSGMTLPLSVTATGSGLTYQWLKDGATIAGANASTLTLTGFDVSKAGMYSVWITNVSGTTTSNGINLTFSNCDYGLYFNGSGSAQVITVPALAVVQPSFTMEFWVKPEPSGIVKYTPLSFNRISGVDAGKFFIQLADYSLISADMGFEIAYYGGGGLGSSARIPKNVWSHVAVTADPAAGNINLYINGLLATSTTGVINAADYSTGAEIKLGSQVPGGENMVGALDEVRIWQGIRSASDIQNNYLLSLPNTVSGLLVNIPFTEMPSTQFTNNATGLKYNRNSATYISPGYSFGPKIVLSGNGNAILPNAATSNLNRTLFIATALNTAFNNTFTIKSVGNTLVGINGISISGVDAGDFTLLSNPNGILSANVSTTFGIQFIATSTGIKTATVTVYSTDYENPVYTFTISGQFTLPANALDFDGINDYVSETYFANRMPTGNQDWTFQTWVNYKGGQSGDRWFAWWGTAAAAEQMILFGINATTNTLKVHRFSGNNRDLSTPFPVNTWTHLSFAYTGANRTLKVYVNGILTDNINNYNADLNLPGSGAIQLGTYNYSTSFASNIIMDEVRVFDYAQSATDILQNYNKTLPSTLTSVMVYYDFEQGYNGINNSTQTTLFDRFTPPSTDLILYNFGLTTTTSNWIHSTVTLSGTFALASPSITGTSLPSSLCFGSPATLNITAIGSNLSFQWYKDGVQLPNATLSGFAIASASSADNGNYYIVVSNPIGNITSSGFNLITTNPPTITGVSSSISTCLGVPNLSISISEMYGNTIQWYNLGNSIAGANASVLTINSNIAQNSIYSARVSNGCGLVTSSGIAVNIIANPTITVTSSPIMACPGLNYTLTASGSGGGGISSYQWYKDGLAIAGATSQSYTITNMASSAVGVYFAVATAACNAVTSSGISVTLECNNALAINGGDQVVFMPYDAGLLVGTSTDLTLEAWIKYTGNSVGFMGIITRQNSGSFYQFSIVNDRIGGEIFNAAGFLGTGQGLTSSTLVNDGQWHHVAMVLTRTTQNAKIYVDGNLEANVNHAAVGGNMDETGPGGYHIGNERGGGNPMPGTMDDVRIWHVALSQQEIQANRYKILNTTVAGLVAYYDYNQGVPGGNNAGLTTLLDRSGNGRNATLSNFALNGSTENWVAANGTTTTTGTYSFLPPVIVSTPTAVNGCPGSILFVNITASGTGLSYAWYKDGVVLAGQNGATLTLSGSNTNTSGTLQAIVSNVAGNVTSTGIIFNAACQNALHFDGNDAITLGNLNYISTGTPGQYTVQAWVYPENFSGDKWIFGDEQAGNGGVGLQLDNGTGRVIAFRPGGLGVTTTTLPLNTWTHLALVQNATGTHLYINGVFDITMFGAGSANVETSFNSYIGAFQGTSRNFSGKIDEVSVWNRALTANEILVNKNRNLVGNENGLVALYKMNQGIANGNNIGLNSLANQGPSVATGSMTGFALTGTTSNWTNSEVSLNGAFLFENEEIEVLGNSITINSGDTSPSTLDGTDFGTVTGLTTRTFTIQNFGSLPLFLTGTPLVSLSGSSDFTVSSLPTSTVGSTSGRTFQISLTPTSIGVKNATVYILNTDSDESVYTFAIAGYSSCNVLNQSVTASILSFCGTGNTDIVLGGSEAGVIYTLRNHPSNIEISTPITGTGSGLTFAGISVTSNQFFNVLASLSGVCASQMSNVVNVTAYSIPAVSANTSSNPICLGNAVVFSGTGANTYTWSGGALDQISFTPSSTSSYTVTGSTAQGCQNTYAFVLTVSALPTVTGLVSQNPVCINQNVTFSGVGATTYTWTNGITNGAAYSYTSAGIYLHTVTGLVGSSCQASAIVVVTVNSLPTVGGTATPNVVCQGQSMTFSGSGAVSYIWNNGATNGASFTAIASGAVQVTGTDANGCSNTSLVNITVNSLPTISVSGNSLICLGQTSTLTVDGAATYSWSNGSTTSVINVNPNITTDYTVTGLSTLGCQNTFITTVTVISLPTVTGTILANPICIGQSTTFVGSGAITYSWTGGITDGIGFQPTVVGIFLQTITGLVGTGCEDFDVVVLTVSGVPTVTGSATPNVVCQGQSITFAGAGAVSYTWNNGATNGASFLPSSSGAVQVTGTDANGCSNTSLVNITVNSLPNVSISATSTAVCPNTYVTLTGVGATSYAYTGGVANTIGFVPTITSSFTITGTDNNSCQNTSTITITLLGVPELLDITTVTTYGVAYSQQTGTVSGVTYSLLNGQLPSGLSLNSGSGLISGTSNTVLGMVSLFTIVGNNGSCTSIKSYEIDVQKANLTIGVIDTAIYQLQNIPAQLRVTATGFVFSDHLSITRFGITTATSAVVGSYPIEIFVSGAALNNYTLTTFAGILQIRSITGIAVSGRGFTKQYGLAIPSLSGALSIDGISQSLTLSGANTITINGVVETINTSYSTNALTNSGVGANNLFVNVSSISISNSYRYSLITLSGAQITIDPLKLRIVADSKVWLDGSPAPTLTGVVTSALTINGVSGIVPGDNVIITYDYEDGTDTTKANYNTPYVITPEARGTALTNYSFVMFTGTVKRLVGVTVTSLNFSKTYGEPVPASVATGYTVVGLTGTATGVNVSNIHAVQINSPAGIYPITPQVLGLDLNKYFLVTVGGVLTVNPAGLTVSATNFFKTAGDANPAFTGQVFGLQSYDAANFNVVYGTEATQASPAGSYAIIPTVSGTALVNYNVILINGNLSVGQAPGQLSISANNVSKTYGDDNPTLTGNITGLVSGDDVQVSYSTTATKGSAVGTYTIIPILSGVDLGKYIISTSTGTLTINKAAISITAPTFTRPYGGNDPSVSSTITGIKNNDSFVASYVNPANIFSNAGDYTVVPEIVGTAISNYDLTTIGGILSISKVEVTVVGAAATRKYKEENPQFKYSIGGFVNRDNINDLDVIPTAITTATSASNVGTYPITLGGGSDNNYTFVYISSSLSITPASQTITVSSVNAKVKTGESVTLTASASSGLPIVISVADSSIVRAQGITFFGLSDGQTTATLSQPGDLNYLAATVVNINILSTSTGIVSLTLLGLTGNTEVVIVEGGNSEKYTFPKKAEFTYSWTFTGASVNPLVSPVPTDNEITLIFNDKSQSGYVIGKIFDLDGNLLKSDSLYVNVINENSINDPSSPNYLNPADPEYQTKLVEYQERKLAATLVKELVKLECEPVITDCKNAYIISFNLGKNISNKSTCSKAGYGDFTTYGKIDTLIMGTSYRMLAGARNKITDASFFAIWIDYGNDGSFEDPDDFVSASYSPDTVFEVKNVVIRNNNDYEGPRRIRVSMRTSGGFTKEQSCPQEGTVGETEDYLVVIRKPDALEAPNLITPNGDAKNDLFVVRGIDPNPKKISNLVIVDRLGNPLFKSDDNYGRSNDAGDVYLWDGKDLNGKMLPDGTYYYFYVNGESKLNGYIEIKTK
ncbi:MAG: LamG-like jellyroll fold domain-containing protein [Cytophagales bacterium]|nr:LamG-like jellyroll fold domain-containing protein [Cytophagales bacterium]